MRTLKTIGQFLAVNIKEVVTYLVATVGGGALGILLSSALSATAGGDEPAGYATVGTIMAIVFAVAVLLFAQSLGGQSDFYITVSMNRARIPYLIGRYVLVIIDILVSLGVIGLINLLELKVVGPAVSVSGEVENLVKFKPEIIAVIVFAVPVLTIFFTAMYVIFDRKFFWALWGIYMLCALGIPRIASAVEKHPESFSAKIGEGFKALAGIGAGPWLIFGAVVTVALLIADIMLYRKMEVKL